MTAPQSVLFDPGYAQHTTILSINAEYIYANISQFKNLGQRKMKFKMIYPQILKMVDNNTGFCLGCMLWAVYIKSLGDIKIDGNPCLDSEYDEAEAVEEIDYSIEFFEKLKKDAKYYLAADYQINPLHIKILELYKEFLTINESFINTKTTNDIKLPASFKTPDNKGLEVIHEKIQQVLQSGNLLELVEVFNLVYEG